jgi:hypothetical protein
MNSKLGLMTTPRMHRRSQTRDFFAHHMLLHAADLQIGEAEASQIGRFNKCLAGMVMTALAIEALLNAVGSRVVVDGPAFEQLGPLDKLDLLVEQLHIQRDASKEPWQTIRYLSRFRNDIAHPKPELVEVTVTLPQAALDKQLFDVPHSQLEREITTGNARRSHSAVYELKGILTDAMPEHLRFGIYTDAWTESTDALR